MCWCMPNVRTPNCGSAACVAAAAAAGQAQTGEREDVLAWMRMQADRIRERNVGADAAVAAHLEVYIEHIVRGSHRGWRHKPREVKGAATPKPNGGENDCG